jgi:hypothetical protein
MRFTRASALPTGLAAWLIWTPSRVIVPPVTAVVLVVLFLGPT